MREPTEAEKRTSEELDMDIYVVMKVLNTWDRHVVDIFNEKEEGDRRRRLDSAG